MRNHEQAREIGELIKANDRFLLVSHVRPDGDAIGSVLALGFSLKAMGKTVTMIAEDGVPESLQFLEGSDQIEVSPEVALDADVAFFLDTATHSRVGARSLAASTKAKTLVNIDHHISNPGYGDLNHIDAESPATGQIIYDLLRFLEMPIPAESRDAIYVAVSTDTGSFQYSATTAETYEMGADLIRRGLDVGKINAETYDSHPFRRLALMRALLNTLELTEDGQIAFWELSRQTQRDLALQPDDSEGLIDLIRGIRGVQLAAFFEELEGGQVRVSLRSKTPEFSVCDVAMEYGGGGHAMAAGIRMGEPLGQVKEKVLSSLKRVVAGEV